MNPDVRKVVVAGGGTAGWMAAAALIHQLKGIVEITLVESDEIGTIGVGESTIPPIRSLNRLLRIDEQEFMRATAATFKLGISFEGWARPGDRYIHSFGAAPLRTWVAEFQHFWLEAQARGEAAEIGAYYPEHEAALKHRFTLQGEPPLNYAYHLDAGLYAKFLRTIAEAGGVTRREGKIAEVELDGESGNVAALKMEDGGYELAKMAVADTARGSGIGRKLIDTCIEEARRAGAHRIYLESNSALTPALTLYRSAGFVDLPAQQTPYARCDVWMELRL